MIRGVSWPLATWIATSMEPKVNTTNDIVAVISPWSIASAPWALKPKKLHPSQWSRSRNSRAVMNSSGIAMNGTIQSEDLR
jgi:hypothetical protein